jgi:hypothetical protein
MGAGQPDKAVATLRKLLTIPSNISIPLLRNDATWDPLRKDPGLQKLLQ